MSVDINRKVIFQQSIDQIGETIGGSHTKIVAGDDGFVSIDQHEDPIFEDNPSGRGRFLKVAGFNGHVGLTPEMVDAVVKWDRTRPRYRKSVTDEEIGEGFHWFYSERSMTATIARKMRVAYYCIDEVGPVTLEELNRRGWEYLAPCERPHSGYIDGDTRGKEA